MRTFWRMIRLLFWLLMIAGSAELAVYLLVEFQLLPISSPQYHFGQLGESFWRDIDPAFGTWHPPHTSYIETVNGSDIVYSSNAYGARDRERQKESAKERVIVIGDSMIEGLHVSEEHRLSNKLEALTAVEHLNFGVSGEVGTIHYWLIYQTLAKQFDHSAVIVSILPANDFIDNDFTYGKKANRFRYRPYLTGEYPNYTLEYCCIQKETLTTSHLSPFLVRYILRDFSYSYHAWVYFKKRNAIKSSFRQQSESLPQRAYSGYYDFDEKQWLGMRYTLEKLRTESTGKELLIITVPVVADFARSKQEATVPPLRTLLKDASTDLGFTYFDLMEDISKTEHFDDLHLPEDPHWTEYGAEVVAQLLLDKWSFYTR